MPDHPGIAGVFVSILGGGLSPAINAKTGIFTAGALVYVRFLDAAGKVVASGSQEFPMHGLMSDAKNVLAKPVRFSRMFDLAPGSYRLEVSVYDEVDTVEAGSPALRFEIVAGRDLLHRFRQCLTDEERHRALVTWNESAARMTLL
jgi:hypothetical protein